MNPRNTWLWVVVAAALFAVIFALEKFVRKPDPGPIRVLPGLRALDVNSVEVLPKGRPAIHAERTNRVWHLINPPYPAQARSIVELLTALEHLTAAPYITPKELKATPNADQQYGFDPPQASLIIGQKNYLVLIGNRTALGDQLFAQVAGADGVYVVDADLLRLIPQSVDEWREKALVDWNQVLFDRLVVTNTGKVLELEFDTASRVWRMVHPISLRADAVKVEAALQQLQGLLVRQFVSDEPKPDLDAYGLQNPDLSLSFSLGTNTVLSLRFGKSPTNSADLVYARRDDRNTIVTVAKDSFQPWLASSSQEFRDFLDHHLFALDRQPDLIEIIAQDNFALQRLTNGTWLVAAPNLQTFPADPELMAEFSSALANLRFTEIEREIVLDPDLPTYGLKPAARQYTLKAADPAAADGSTNSVLTQLDFGIRDDKAYARRKGEDFVYAINPRDLDRLPTASWQMRERQIWNFSETNVARIAIRQNGKEFAVVHHGPNSWGLAPGSQGVINSGAMEEVAHRLGGLSAASWIARGDQDRAQYGFTTNACELVVELNDGRKLSVELGCPSNSGHVCAMVKLDQEPWIFETPLSVRLFVQQYLKLPADTP